MSGNVLIRGVEDAQAREVSRTASRPVEKALIWIRIADPLQAYGAAECSAFHRR
jgi:hypothetical protein